MVVNDNAGPTIENCVFENNHVYPAIECDYPAGTPLIIGCIFTGNSAGGVRVNYSGHPTIVNCLFYDNRTSGAIYVDSSADATVVNCTIVDNLYSSGGGGIHCVGVADPDVTNCIIRDNEPNNIYGNYAAVTYSNIEGGYTGQGNIDVDPLFVDPNNFDYRINDGSPCIDAGNNHAVPDDIDTDIDGNPRFIDDPFTNDTGMGDPPIVDMGVNEIQLPPEGMVVTPQTDFYSEGAVGGPFSPPAVSYFLENFESYSLEYSVSKTAFWLDVSSDDGVIPVGGQIEIVVSLNALADDLPKGDYFDTVEFVNETNHVGDTARSVTLAVGVPLPIVVFNLDDNPGWSTEGQWAFGKPAGQGGGSHGYPDPSSGYTGQNVFGVNLYGNYSTNVGGPYYLTTNAIDCSAMSEVSLQFRRWLNCDYRPYAYETIEASSDGVNWTTVWDNLGGSAIVEQNWYAYDYDLSAIADGQATLYVRWGHEIRNSGALPYSGWNIDDIEIWGVAGGVACPWDVNGDELVDIDDLFGVLAHWGEGPGIYDVDNDGQVDINDVFAILANWGPCP